MTDTLDELVAKATGLPWVTGEACEYPPEPPIIPINVPEGSVEDTIAEVWGGNHDHEANAALIIRATSTIVAARDALREAEEMLVWCGGSNDFQVDGKAREGWERGVIPAQERIRAVLAQIEGKDQ